MSWGDYAIGIVVVLLAAAIAFAALASEWDDLHRLLLVDLVEIPSLAIIALLGTDLAEALILPGLVVGIAEILALSQIFLMKEGLQEKPEGRLRIEVIEEADAPLILAVLLISYGIILSGFTGGAVAALGAIFLVLARGMNEPHGLLETAAGFSWATWIIAFFIFMFAPAYWLFAVFAAGGGILLKVLAKLSLLGGMWGEPRA